VGAGSRFEPFRVRETQLLSDALGAGVVESDTRLHAALYALTFPGTTIYEP